MPSSHAQFMWFLSSYLVLFLFIRVHNNIQFIDNIWKYLTALGALGVAAIVCFSRVYLGYHSFSQVCWGGVVGCVLGVLWFCVVHQALTPLFPEIAAWPICEFLMIRDFSLIPNVMWFEYTCARGEAKNRQRKITSRKSQ